MSLSCLADAGDHGVTAPIDVHLMVSPVDRIVGDFIDAGLFSLLENLSVFCAQIPRCVSPAIPLRWVNVLRAVRRAVGFLCLRRAWCQMWQGKSSRMQRRHTHLRRLVVGCTHANVAVCTLVFPSTGGTAPKRRGARRCRGRTCLTTTAWPGAS